MHVYHCVTSPFLLFTVQSLSVKEQQTHTRVVEVFKVKFSPILVWCTTSVTQNAESPCHLLCFRMHHTLSMGHMSGLEASQSMDNALLLQNHAVVTHADTSFWMQLINGFQPVSPFILLSQEFTVVFWPCPLYAEISSLSLWILHYIMGCTWWNS